LLVLSIPLVLFYLAHQIMNRRAGSDHPPRLEIKVWLWGLLGIAISFGVLRNLPGFDWLCP
jgi:multisubunit Na+/H+ antiporter MnhB subunit